MSTVPSRLQAIEGRRLCFCLLVLSQLVVQSMHVINTTHVSSKVRDKKKQLLLKGKDLHPWVITARKGDNRNRAGSALVVRSSAGYVMFDACVTKPNLSLFNLSLGRFLWILKSEIKTATWICIICFIHYFYDMKIIKQFSKQRVITIIEQ